MSSAKTTVLERAEGTSFTVASWPAVTSTEGGDGPAPVLLIEPAMGMPASYYHRLGAAFADAGFNAVLTELRGHEAPNDGPGGRIPSHRYDFGYRDMVEDLDASVAEAERQFPGAPITLLGHSMGGQVAMAYVAADPGRIAGLVLIGSGTPYWRRFSIGLLAAAPFFVLTAQLLGHFPGKRFRFAARESKGLIRDWARLAVTGRLTGATRAQLDAVTLPILAFLIAGDSLAPDGSVRGLVEQVPQATVAWERLDMEGVDHFKWARRPETVIPQITAWASSLH
jgi:predicted alpha/beta hydrolase